MHTYVLMRGTRWLSDKYISALENQWLPYKNKKLGCEIAQLSVKPIQLLEIVYPHDQYDIVNNTLWPQGLQPHSFGRQFMLDSLKKMLGARDMPELDQKKGSLPVPLLCQKQIAMYRVGIRDDKIDEDGNEAL